MSAWRIGTEGQTEEITYGGPGDGVGGATKQLAAFVERLTDWIPSEVLGIYLAGVTVLASGGQGSPSVPFLIVMAVVTPIVVVLAAFSTGNPITQRVWVRAALGFGAFLIWSLTVPLSGWQTLDVVATNAGIIAIISAIAGLLFGQFAEGVSKRIAA